MRLGVSFEPAIPVGLEFRPALDALPESAERLVGYIKGGLERPSVGFEPFAYVFGESDLSVAVDRDVIVVVEVDDVAEAEMACDRIGLALDAFHHVTVAGDRENLMV